MNHCPEEKKKSHPREKANIFSLLTFAYIVKALTKAFKQDLKDDDLYEVLTRLRSNRCGEKLERYWFNEKDIKSTGKPLSVPQVIWRRWGKRYVMFGIVDFLYSTLANILKPWAVSNLIGYFVPGQTAISKNELFFFGILLIVQSLSGVVYYHNYILWGQTFGIEVKTAFSSMLYRKALRLSPAALSKISMGNIVTMITKDVQTFRISIWVFNDLWNGFLQVIIICILLLIKVGPVSLFGIGFMIVTLPMQAFLGKCITKLRLETNKKTDERLQVAQEVLSTMKIIKMYTWECFFMSKINQTRRKEVAKFLLCFYLKAVMVILGIISSKVGFYILLTVSMWMGVTIDTKIVLYCLMAFQDLKKWLGITIPATMGQVAELLSAYSRIIETLEADELNPEEQFDKATEKPLVEIKDATVVIKDQPILSDISFTLTSGLTLVTGSVGSGKSSLFKVLLQDYPLSKGSLVTDGRISYASQDPWLFPSSIKQNILFGQEYNEKRYQEVIRVCALLFDFNILEHRDETIVSDRGQNLSKGQQARINLARAIYRESEIYLLDDCLTALDAAVQDYIFRECIQIFLKEKIVILVSQSASHIFEADNVIIMDKGRIKDMGLPDDDIIDEVKHLAVEDDDLEKEVIEDDEESNVEDEKTGLIETEQFTSKAKVYSEVKKEGAVEFEVYKKYCMYGGGIFMVLVNLFAASASQYTYSYSDKLLTVWIDKQQTYLNMEQNITTYGYHSGINATILNEVVSSEKSIFRLYSIMLVLATVSDLIRTYLQLDFCRRAAVNIHKVMTYKIVNAVMSFFDTHLIGNVLNRFSQDMMNLDENLAYVLLEFSTVFFEVLGQLILIMSVSLKFSIYVTIMLAAVVLLRHLYIPAGRSLKRLEASTRSPMIGHINATLEGLTTIRACKAEEILIDEYDRHQDLYTSANYISVSTNRGIGFMMDFICTTFLGVVIIKFLFFYADTTAGEVALAVTQVFHFVKNFQWGVREWAELEALMTSVERILEYTDIQTENKDGLVEESWPSKGAITYDNVSLSYQNSEDYVLKNLNFSIKPMERVGIVGRTGAGKSSIISTIFRLYEVQGRIFIDGVDLKTLSLDFLRKHIAIIPQDPILFSGTIRTNLDPFKEFADADLWSTLEKVGMRKEIDNLDQVVNSTDLNFSLGQKQLICLARAILRKSKIVIMDEATANMDHETDAALHKLIKENFTNSTVLTIAHRLHSILECDKVMVLDRGEIKEFSDPLTLLDNQDGLFHKMVKQAGLLNYLS